MNKKHRRISSNTPMRLVRVRNNALRWRYMITKIAQRRALALTVWENHGIVASCDAFSVSRSTLYRWRKSVRKGRGHLTSLNPKRKERIKKNKRDTHWRIKEWLIEQRKEHPRIGKAKLTPLLKKQCIHWNIPTPSESTIGRILADLKKAGRLPSGEKLSFHAKTGKHHVVARKKRKKRRKKKYQPTTPGSLIELDTVVLFNNGIRRYIITAIDVKTRFAYAKAYTTASSQTAKDFFKELEQVLPFTITHIQTDNGSEFEKHFRNHIEEQDIVHFHTYPRCPRMNGHIERFNRTIQEEFVNHHWFTMFTDLPTFQTLLIDYLLWYNTVRPHHALNLTTPAWYIANQLAEVSHVG